MEYEKIEQTKARLAEVDIQLTKAEAQYAMIVEMMRAVLKLQEKYVQLDKVFNLRKEKIELQAILDNSDENSKKSAD